MLASETQNLTGKWFQEHIHHRHSLLVMEALWLYLEWRASPKLPARQLLLAGTSHCNRLQAMS